MVREGWNGYNVFHDTASRVAALDVGFLPSARASSAPPSKFVYLLGSDDYREEDIPQDAFVVYQVKSPGGPAQNRLPVPCTYLAHHPSMVICAALCCIVAQYYHCVVGPCHSGKLPFSCLSLCCLPAVLLVSAISFQTRVLSLSFFVFYICSSWISGTAGPSWRPGRPSSKCDSAGTCLHREGGDVCKHRGPAATHQGGCAHAW